MNRLRSALSFSNVVACLALFLALGGTVYAASKISGRQIKPHSLPGNRLKPKTLTGRQVKPHSLKAAQIDQSTLKDITAARLGVQYAVASVSLARFSSKGTTASAACPPGTNAIGGGATLNDEEHGYVNDSGPTEQRTGWTATGFAYGPSVTTMTVTAICTAVTQPVGAGPPTYHPTG